MSNGEGKYSSRYSSGVSRSPSLFRSIRSPSSPNSFRSPSNSLKSPVAATSASFLNSISAYPMSMRSPAHSSSVRSPLGATYTPPGGIVRRQQHVSLRISPIVPRSQPTKRRLTLDGDVEGSQKSQNSVSSSLNQSEPCFQPEFGEYR